MGLGTEDLDERQFLLYQVISAFETFMDRYYGDYPSQQVDAFELILIDTATSEDYEDDELES